MLKLTQFLATFFRHTFSQYQWLCSANYIINYTMKNRQTWTFTIHPGYMCMRVVLSSTKHASVFGAKKYYLIFITFTITTEQKLQGVGESYLILNYHSEQRAINPKWCRVELRLSQPYILCVLYAPPHNTTANYFLSHLSNLAIDSHHFNHIKIWWL